MNDDQVTGGAFLGLVIFGFFVWFLSKLVTSVFHDLGLMFDAIGTATVSFFAMAWAITKLVAILSAAIGVAYAAYRYYQLVKQATEILATVDDRCSETIHTVTKAQAELEQRLTDEVTSLRRALEKALAKPEVAPTPPEVAEPKAETAATVQVLLPNESVPTPRVSNPY